MPSNYTFGYCPEDGAWKKLRVDSDGSIHVVGYVDKLDDIGDVTVPSPTDGYIVYWDATASKWKCKAIPAPAWAAITGKPTSPSLEELATQHDAAGLHLGMVLDNIGNVNAPTPSNMDLLVWSAATSKWINYANWAVPHFARHQDGGADEIWVGGLSGKLADAQTPLAHKTSHQDGGADELSVEGLLGVLSSYQTSHWTMVAGKPATFPPDAHKTSHQDTGTDEISIAGLDGSPAQKGAASGLASLNAASKVVEQPAAITDFLEDTPTDGVVTKAPTSNWAYDHAANKSAHQSNVITITFIIDGGGSAIAVGQKGHLEIPFACTLTAWTLVANVAGAIVIDVWKDTYANFPPTDADAMPGAGKEPTIAATNQMAQDTDISDWTTVAISAGNILAFNVDSCTTITRVTLSLKATKT